MYNLTIMKADQQFPSFDDQFPELNQFILKLVDTYNAGKINSWDDLEERVNAFFTPERMDEMEVALPGWQKMTSYSDGVTLTHVMCVFLGLFMLPEFLTLTPSQRGLMKWIILLHDIEKEYKNGKKDHTHAVRSAKAAANLLPAFGFGKTSEYDLLINDWSQLTISTVTMAGGSSDFIQDNHKLPEILSGIEALFDKDSPAALIVKIVHCTCPSMWWMIGPRPHP